MSTKAELLIRELMVHVRAAAGQPNVLTFTGCTESVASDGGVVLADGADFSRFALNPMIMWRHGQVSEVPVVGRAIAWRRSGTSWEFDILFAVDESPLAAQLYRLALAGFLPATSIGFQVTERIDNPTPAQVAQYGLGPWGWIATKWELHELSLVPVGADPMALKRAVESGALRSGDETIASVRTETMIDPNMMTRADAATLTSAIDSLTQAVNELHTMLSQPEDEPAADEVMDPKDPADPAESTEPDDAADTEDDAAEPKMSDETGRGAKPMTPSASDDAGTTDRIAAEIDALRDRYSRLRGATNVSGNPVKAGPARK